MYTFNSNIMYLYAYIAIKVSVGTSIVIYAKAYGKCVNPLAG